MQDRKLLCYALGRRTNLFSHSFCRINAAFHLATERRIYAAAKNCVVRPKPLSAVQRIWPPNRPHKSAIRPWNVFKSLGFCYLKCK